MLRAASCEPPGPTRRRFDSPTKLKFSRSERSRTFSSTEFSKVATFESRSFFFFFLSSQLDSPTTVFSAVMQRQLRYLTHRFTITIAATSAALRSRKKVFQRIKPSNYCPRFPSLIINIERDNEPPFQDLEKPRL